MVENITITQSNRLNLSRAYPLKPSPMSLMIISPKKSQEKVVFASSRELNMTGSIGSESKASERVLPKIKKIINASNILCLQVT